MTKASRLRNAKRRNRRAKHPNKMHKHFVEQAKTLREHRKVLEATLLAVLSKGTGTVELSESDYTLVEDARLKIHSERGRVTVSLEMPEEEAEAAE